jgi:3'-5' exoribonuclease
MKLTQISNFKKGKNIQGFFLCKDKQIRQTRAGDLYIDIVLFDKSGFVSAKVWDLVDQYKNKFETGDPVAVKGKVIEFNNGIQLSVTKINLATKSKYDKYGFDTSLLIPTISENIHDLYQELINLVNVIKNPKLKKLLLSIFENNKERVCILPASVDYHHALRGGYLKHTVSVGKSAVSISQIHTNLDSDILIAGALLHDIGTLRVIDESINSQYTLEGNLFGHVVLGRDLFLEEVSRIKNFPEDIKLMLEHIILSHQGALSKGSPRTPKFPEALVIHYLDELDGKLDIMNTAISLDNEKSDWTDSRNIFHTQLWKHKIKTS